MRWRRALLVLSTLGVLAAPAAHAQSDALLDKVRLHAPDAPAAAKAELASCEAKSCPDADTLSLLTGYLVLADGDAETALTQLRAHAAPKGLEPWHAFYVGEALFYTQHYAEAARVFQDALAGAPRSLSERLAARTGEAWLAAGNAPAALPFLEEAAGQQDSPELYLERAIARQLTGAVDAAKADWVQLCLRFPHRSEAQKALSLLTEAAGKPPTFTFDEHVRRAHALLDFGRPEGALGELVAIDDEKLSRGATAKSALAYLRAQVLFALGKATEAEAALDVAAKGGRPLAAQVAMLRARRALGGKDREKARTLLAEVDRKFPSDAVADDAGYLASWIDLQMGHLDRAVKSFIAFEKRHPHSRKLDEALWFRGLALILQEQYPQAQKVLEDLAHRFSRSSLVPQALYWDARVIQLQSGAPDLAARYQKVVTDFPGSYYAVLARARIAELKQTPPLPFPDPPKPVDTKTPPELARAEALAKAGLFRDARVEVDVTLSHVHSVDDAIRFGLALQRLGDFGSAYQLANRLLWGPAFNDKKPEAVALFYPRAFESAVTQAAKEADVAPWLVWAIMRRESAFKPEVSSPADARGLMQLIPPTAQEIAKRLGDALASPDALYAPQVNIKFGAWYLAKLWERFGHPALVAAAYNAGPGAVVRWLKENGTRPVDLFVELIPFKETRGYVKQVMGDYYLYQTLYLPPDAPHEPVALTLPSAKAEGVDF